MDAAAVSQVTLTSLSARIDAVETAAADFREDITRVPTLLDRAITGVNRFQDERYAHITLMTDAHFSTNAERIKALSDTLTSHERSNNERFLDTDKHSREREQVIRELIAERNRADDIATTKAEASFTKQIDQLADRVGDLKERLIASDGKASVQDPATRTALAEMSSAILRLSAGANVGEGRSKQSEETTSKSFSLMALVVAIGAVLVDILHPFVVSH